MITITDEGRRTEMMWTAHDGKRRVKLTIRKIEGVIVEPNEDFNFEPKPFSIYGEESPPFLNLICAKTSVVIQNSNKMSHSSMVLVFALMKNLSP